MASSDRPRHVHGLARSEDVRLAKPFVACGCAPLAACETCPPGDVRIVPLDGSARFLKRLEAWSVTHPFVPLLLLDESGTAVPGCPPGACPSWALVAWPEMLPRALARIAAGLDPLGLGPHHFGFVWDRLNGRMAVALRELFSCQGGSPSLGEITRRHALDASALSRTFSASGQAWSDLSSQRAAALLSFRSWMSGQPLEATARSSGIPLPRARRLLRRCHLNGASAGESPAEVLTAWFRRVQHLARRKRLALASPAGRGDSEGEPTHPKEPRT